MKNQLNLVELVEMWANKKITIEEMKAQYAKIPAEIPETWEYYEDVDPIMYTQGNNNTLLEVKAILVYSNKISLEKYFEFCDLVRDID